MSIALRTSNELLPQIERLLNRLLPRLRELCPEAELHHIGSTAVPGSLTKGDVDVLLRVSPAGFAAVVNTLKQHFEVRQPGNWSAEFASFGDDASFDFPVGLQITVMDSSADFLLALRDYFINSPEALRDYNRLKAAHCHGSREDYWKAKDRFLAKILASPGQWRRAGTE